MSTDGSNARRLGGRILIGLGIAAMAVAVLRMNARALGGPPEHPGDFSTRRTHRQVRAEVHDGFAEFAVLGLAGFALMLFGARLAGGCTSGHAISGNLQLATSSWMFTGALFVGGILTAKALYTKRS